LREEQERRGVKKGKRVRREKESLQLIGISKLAARPIH